jgi:hypothetical protein
MNRMRRMEWLNVRNIGILLAAISLLVTAIGYLMQRGIDPTFDLKALFLEIWSNVASEAAGIAITVLIIDGLNQRREAQNEKERLMRQLSSKDEGLAFQALEELRALGMLKDGSMKGATLVRANLKGARLGGANWSNTDLLEANLQATDLYLTVLRGARLQGAALQDAEMLYVDLANADLRGANLRGADLREANLQGANLGETKFDENTMLPDRNRWSADIDMERFTNPQHEKFWRSDNPHSPAHPNPQRGGQPNGKAPEKSLPPN